MQLGDYILVWFGLITTGFFIGVGSKTAEYVYEIYLKKRYDKIHSIIKPKEKVK